MRTTLTIEDDAFNAARTYAQARAMKLGEAVSELIRRGSSERLAIRQSGEAWVFALPADTPKVTSEHVKALLDDAL